MRVLHVQKAAGIGGSERHLLMLLPALREAGVEVRACVAVTGDGRRFADELRARDIDVREADAGPDLNPRLVRWLTQQAREFQPAILHTHLIHADLHGQIAARLAHVPSVSSVHGTLAALRRPPYRSVGRAIGRVTPLTIAISVHVQRFLESLRLRTAGSVRVVHYGLDPHGWPATPAERQSARATFELEDDDVAVAITARLIPGKGHDLLLDALGDALRSEPRLRLLVAGDGPTRTELGRQARALPAGAVRFLDFMPDVRPLVQACDVLAFPTAPELGEGFGLAALEAMAAERPVVATAVGALPEVVAHGQTGIVVPPGDRGQLADALVRLARDPGLRARLGAAGRERARTEFSIGRMIGRTLAVYEEALPRAV